MGTAMAARAALPKVAAAEAGVVADARRVHPTRAPFDLLGLAPGGKR
jgi:hypothetical protein